MKRPAQAAPAACPCGSGLAYAQCCGPLHAGERRAQSAEALMRSRYSAFVQRDAIYLLASWHPSTRPTELDLSSDATRWLGLKIIACEAGGTTDVHGRVEFVARGKLGGKAFRLHERSRFERIEGVWYYLDGEIEDV